MDKDGQYLALIYVAIHIHIQIIWNSQALISNSLGNNWTAYNSFGPFPAPFSVLTCCVDCVGCTSPLRRTRRPGRWAHSRSSPRDSRRKRCIRTWPPPSPHPYYYYYHHYFVSCIGREGLVSARASSSSSAAVAVAVEAPSSPCPSWRRTYWGSRDAVSVAGPKRHHCAVARSGWGWDTWTWMRTIAAFRPDRQWSNLY